MQRIGALVIGFLVLALAAAPARAALPAEQPYRIGFSGRLATDVYIDGQGPFNFLIDTASSRSLIFQHVRDRLGLGQSQPQLLTVYGINDVAQATPVKPGTVTVAGEAMRDMTLAVLPDVGGNGPDGILGTDFLSRYVVVLDRSAMRLTLLAPGSDAARTYRNWTGMPLTRRPLKNLPVEFWYLQTSFDDTRITALFDLGAAMTMLNWQAAERLDIHQRTYAQYGPPPEALQDVLGKRAPALRVTGMNIALNGRLWRDQFVMVADAPVFDYFDLDEHPAAIVGLDLLGANSLAIDFAAGRLYVGPKAPAPSG
jgi:predicted aspartyl protease